jgi:hypothetical protein
MLSPDELNKYLAAKNQDLQSKQELIDSLQRETKTLRAEMDKVYALYMSDQILNQARNLAEFWPDMTKEGKRQIAESIVERITLGKEEIQIDLCYLPAQNRSKPGYDPDDGGDAPPPFENDGHPYNAHSISAFFSKARAFGKNMVKGVQGPEALCRGLGRSLKRRLVCKRDSRCG